MWLRKKNLKTFHCHLSDIIPMLARSVLPGLLAASLCAFMALPGEARQIPILPTSGQTPAETAPPAPKDPLGRSSPYEMVTSFIKAVDAEDWENAAEYLDSRQPQERKQDLARTLMRAMNLGLTLDLGSLSRRPEGNLSDRYRDNRDLLGTVRIGNDSLEIFLDRIQRGNNLPVWLFSTETLLILPDFAAQAMETSWIERSVPSWLMETRFWGISLYRWIFIPIGLALAIVVAWLAAWIVVRLYGRIFRTPIRKRMFLQETGFTAPLRLLFFATTISLGAKFGSTLVARLAWSRLSTILVVMAFAWLLLRIIDFASLNLTSYLRQTRAQHQIAAVQLFRGAAKALTVIIAVLAVLKTQGVDLSTAIAGLGIGGLAFAFAAQKTIENLFGTVMLVGDQPVRVGDFCRVGDTLGTIENIGLRSTRIRTLKRTMVSVPNGQVASMILENFAPRDKMWFSHTIGLRYETSADQLRYVLANIRAMLYAHPRVESESARIRFVGFGNSSLDLEIFAYVSAKDNTLFLEIQEDLLLRIMDIVEASGTGMAFPSQTTYLAKDAGLDSEKSKAAAAQVEQWKREQALPFPNHSSETIMKIQDSLDYPPPESAVHQNK